MRTAVTSLVPNCGKSRAFNPLINTQVRGWLLKHPRNRLIPLVFKPSIFSLRIQGSWTNAITVSYSDSSVQTRRRNVQLLARPITAVPHRLLCTSIRRLSMAASSIRYSSSLGGSTMPAQHTRSTGLLCGQLWNSLPDSLRDPDHDRDSFRYLLKTHLSTLY